MFLFSKDSYEIFRLVLLPMDEHNELELEMDLVLIVGHIVMEKQQQHYMVEQFVDLAYDLAYPVVDKHQPKTMVVLE
jgi:hypothetical protein